MIRAEHCNVYGKLVVKNVINAITKVTVMCTCEHLAFYVLFVK